MSAIHADRATAQRAEIHVGLSDETLAGLAARSVYIPAPHAGAAYERVLLDPDRDDLADIGDSAEIPQLGSFVREYIRKAQNRTEVQP